MKKVFFLVFSFLYIGLANAQLAVKSIAVFKNGTAFIHKSGTVKTENSTFKWDKDLPLALYGTFWFASPNGNIKSISSTTGKIESEEKWETFFELLKANKSKKATIFLDGDKSISGTIQDVRGEREGNVILTTNDDFHVIKSTKISAVKIEGGMNETFRKVETKAYININFTNTNALQKLETMYLSKGFNWTPMYRLVLNSETEGQLYLKASLVNNGESFINTNMKLMVGSPNMYTTSQLSDLLNFNTLRSASTLRTNFSNKSSGFYKRSDNNEGSFGGNTTSIATGLEDLYFFDLKGVTLNKGDRAFYPLFNTKVKVEHKYVCNLNANTTVNNNYFRGKYGSENVGSTVNHQLKVWNKSKNPFSSGTILINKIVDEEQQALATAKLDYTAINNCAYVTLSNAPDIEIKEEEKEIERTNTSKFWNNQKYIAIKVQSTITIKSYKQKDVQMEVKRLIYGDFKESDTTWEKNEVINNYYLNTGNNVTWKFELEGGKEKKIVYTYMVYVRV
jgi:hypothetical protein